MTCLLKMDVQFAKLNNQRLMMVVDGFCFMFMCVYNINDINGYLNLINGLMMADG